jgi:hypothetical protein
VPHKSATQTNGFLEAFDVQTSPL